MSKAIDLTLNEISEMILHPKNKTWSWLGCMLAGEAGEAANVLKKMEADDTPDRREHLSKELADVIASVVIIAHKMEINLSMAVKSKIEAFRNDPEKMKLYNSI